MSEESIFGIDIKEWEMEMEKLDILNDEEVLNHEFTEEELKQLCKRKCVVQMAERNIYHAFEIMGIKQLQGRGKVINDVYLKAIHDKFMEKYAHIYKNKFLVWEAEHKKNLQHSRKIEKHRSLIYLNKIKRKNEEYESVETDTEDMVPMPFSYDESFNIGSKVTLSDHIDNSINDSTESTLDSNFANIENGQSQESTELSTYTEFDERLNNKCTTVKATSTQDSICKVINKF